MKLFYILIIVVATQIYVLKFKELYTPKGSILLYNDNLKNKTI